MRSYTVASIAAVALTSLTVCGCLIVSTGSLRAQEHLPALVEDAIRASDGAEGDNFGASLVVAGDIMVVAAPWADLEETAGAVYVYVRDTDSGAWVEHQHLLPVSGTFGDSFLQLNLAIEGETIVVGAPYTTLRNFQEGVVYIFDRDAEGMWTQTARLTDPSVDHGGHFGGSLALEGNTLVIGAPQDSSDRNGLVYVFDRDAGGAWIRSATITHSAVNDAAFPKSFGASVSLDGDLLLIGAPRTLLAFNTYDGAAYLFRRRGQARWDYLTRLVRPGAADCTGGLPFLQFNNEATAEEREDAADCADLNPVQNGSFGRRVALDGDLAAVTADSANAEDGTFSVGEAHVFAHEVAEDAWAHSAKLGGSLTSASAHFGNALALNDGAVLVGASSTTIEGRSRQGSAHFFQRTAGDDETWHEVQTLLASDGVSDASFGAAVAFDGPRLAIGASGDGNFRGAVYVWTPTDGTDEPDPTGPAFPPTGELVGDTVFVHPSGVVLGAVEGAALEPLPVWVYEVPRPSEAMLEVATPIGGYFNIGASTTTWMPAEETFAVALPVPPTANVNQLALAALVPAETLLDGTTADRAGMDPRSGHARHRQRSLLRHPRWPHRSGRDRRPDRTFRFGNKRSEPTSTADRPERQF